MPIELTERQRRLIDAALILAVVALGFVVLTDLAGVFYAFGDILLLFFLAWLLSFALLPLIRGVSSLIPRMPQAGAVIIVYLAIVALLLAVGRPGVRVPRHVDRAVHPGRAAVRGAAAEPPDAGAGAASRPRVPGGPREPGADHRGEPPDVGAAARRAAPVARVREHRRVRQRAAAG
jgi:hypothetical protein